MIFLTTLPRSSIRPSLVPALTAQTATIRWIVPLFLSILLTVLPCLSALQSMSSIALVSARLPQPAALQSLRVAVVPSTTHSHPSHRSDLDGFVSSDSWFIGALDAGGVDAQGWSSGILGFKALDKFHDYNGLPFAKFAPCPRPLLRGAPPKLRNRERSAQRPGAVPHRNSSPPPLPKSASLPLHADHRLQDFLPVAPQSSHLITDQKRLAVHAPPVAHTISRTSSTSGTPDHSSSIAEVLRQITSAQASVHDLQNQLQEAQNATNQSRDLLETELGDLRLKRKEEEQRRIDGRARTKTLEEARRQAEINKREAEKKMKAARNAKDSAIRRVEELENQIQRLKDRMERDRAFLTTEPSDVDTAEEEELVCELERKRKEVRVAEEVVVTLNTRARELEEKIDTEKSRLRACTPPRSTCQGIPRLEHFQRDIESESRDASRSPLVHRAQGHAILDGDIPSIDSTSLPSDAGHNGYFQLGHATSFSPFCDPPTPSAAFIPSSLISVLDSPSTDWKGGFGIQNVPLTASPIEFTGDSLEVEEHDSSGFRRPQGRSSHDSLYETQRSDDLPEIARQSAETPPQGWFTILGSEKRRSGLNPDAKVFRLTRFTSDKAGSSDVSPTSVSSFDALNPTGLMSNITSSTPSSLLRAFAPSRAEREALHRALGGSTNTSLERLPSLSDVGSIPSSPVHTHAEAQGRSIGEKDCALPAWLQSLPLIRKPNFSPWEDEDPVSTDVKR
ncbi:hypothetical protein JVU11DRAFT_2654 [Chiua virens]|nr:hypothetical protein JVU11DRAFT_2654 [Chiua virens]